MDVNRVNHNNFKIANTKIDNNNVDLKKLKKACSEFESFFYQLIFKEARKSVGENSFFQKSKAETIFTEMMDTEISKQIAARSENGIKDMLFNYFMKSLGKHVESKDIKIDLIG